MCVCVLCFSLKVAHVVNMSQESMQPSPKEFAWQLHDGSFSLTLQLLPCQPAKQSHDPVSELHLPWPEQSSNMVQALTHDHPPYPSSLHVQFSEAAAMDELLLHDNELDDHDDELELLLLLLNDDDDDDDELEELDGDDFDAVNLVLHVSPSH